MPHLVLEASSNIIESNTAIKECLTECHNILTAKLPAQLAKCKSRFIKHDVYVVGDGASKNAFVHCEISIIAGRSSMVLTETIGALKDHLTRSFAGSAAKLDLKISIELCELNQYYTQF
jgi:5-carboxymethyl-2-hydroxymuconate isomerase